MFLCTCLWSSRARSWYADLWKIDIYIFLCIGLIHDKPYTKAYSNDCDQKHEKVCEICRVIHKESEK